MQASTHYHAPTYTPTVDELEALKTLELGEQMSAGQVLHAHWSPRLLEWGLIRKTDDGSVAITDAGRQQIRRTVV